MFKLTGVMSIGTLLTLGYASVGLGSDAMRQAHDCDENGSLCTEVFDSIGYNGSYTGHDEPALLFYSNEPGSGNHMTYRVRVPKDPPMLPTQDGRGGTFNFQLHPAFWVSVVMCDDQSNPNPGGSNVGANIPCMPDSDRNIYDSREPNDAHYIGKHPGTAFMEMQFYPPNWIGGCGDPNHPTQWCSALNIDSFSSNANTGQANNASCLSHALGGGEPVNFAFVTKSGKPVGPPSPLFANNATFTQTSDVLFYNPGDWLRITLQDTAHGLQITIKDETTGEDGSMTASARNGFAEVLFDPSGNCDTRAALAAHNVPTNFHPMYATSNEHTRVPWAAHSYNVSFTDEIGHFEYCNAISSEGGQCTQDGVGDKDNGLPSGAEDDDGCFSAGLNASLGFVAIGGCLAFSTDFDFDGPPYKRVWPGTASSVQRDQKFHAQPVQFKSPVFNTKGDVASKNYSRVAFETDLPRIESNTNPPCQRHLANPSDPNPGKDCVNPAKGANFYPIFTVRGDGAGCLWQLGGAQLPGTTRWFGGKSAAEYGPLLTLAYPVPGPGVSLRYNDFRHILPNNPCPTKSD
jgi:hypothetical protein